jgi:hypothetical protein
MIAFRLPPLAGKSIAASIANTAITTNTSTNVSAWFL